MDGNAVNCAMGCARSSTAGSQTLCPESLHAPAAAANLSDLDAKASQSSEFNESSID
jgi:hypothetical protein